MNSSPGSNLKNSKWPIQEIVAKSSVHKENKYPEVFGAEDSESSVRFFLNSNWQIEDGG